MADLREVRRIAVIGAGIMGSGIAQISLLGGYEKVVLSDIDSSALENGRRAIELLVRALETEGQLEEYLVSNLGMRRLSSQSLAQFEANRKTIGVIAQGQTTDAILKRLVCEPDLQKAVSAVDFVIEAVPEKLALKQEVFRQLSEFTPPHVVCASNTSTLPVSKLARFSRRPEKVIGMHFHGFRQAFNRLIEIMGDDKTAVKSLEIGRLVGESLPSLAGKRLIVRLEKEAVGFIANRIAAPAGIYNSWLLDQALEQGITLEQLQAAGIELRNYDYVGLDTALNAMKSYQENLSPDFVPAKVIVDLVRQGRLGRKTGWGMFKWDSSGNPIIPDTSVEEKTLKFMQDNAVPELALAARLNEACRLLEMGVVKGCEVINELERIGEAREGIFVLGWDKYPDWTTKLAATAVKIGKDYLKPVEMMRSGRFKDYP